MQLTERLLTFWNDIPESIYRTLPAYLIKIFASVIMTARRTAAYVMANLPKTIHGRFTNATLDHAEARLNNCGERIQRALRLSRKITEATLGERFDSWTTQASFCTRRILMMQVLLLDKKMPLVMRAPATTSPWALISVLTLRRYLVIWISRKDFGTRISLHGHFID